MNIISEKKIAANRRNSLKSTGPRTGRGKAVASRNAIKYGILGDAVLVRGLAAKESPREYTHLYQEFQENLRPVGLLEEMLTGQIAATAWRLRRARKAEAGEIAVSVDVTCRHKIDADPITLTAQWESSSDLVYAMEKSKLGNEVIIKWLKDVRVKVEQAGELTKKSAKIPCGDRRNAVSDRLQEIRLVLARREDGVDEATHREQVKRQTLMFIDDLIHNYELKMEACEAQEQMDDESRRAAAMLPGEKTLGKILRYESSLERQLFRAMNQLERLQERRRKSEGEEPLPEKHEIAKRSQLGNETIS
ncbi:MAG TPA: hypothetical protein VG347_24520 [Verrucomicrobiae bacterium]|nr:hypothetical protein [Verrucomicrobiae bacterium]